MTPEDFLTTQRQLREDARLRAMVNRQGTKDAMIGQGRSLSGNMLRALAKMRLKRKRAREGLSTFLREVRSRKAEGYSAAQLLRSYIPDLGGENKVPEADIKAEMKKHDFLFLLMGVPD